MPADVDLRPAGAKDRAYVESLLGDSGLPVADLPGAIDDLYVCEVGGERVGVGGLEQYRDVALLRSVAVEEPARGEGYGTQLCAGLLERARGAGVDEVYLLTTTAGEFFARLGFERVDRADVPDPIRRTDEFSDLCPATAACMRRELRSPASVA